MLEFSLSKHSAMTSLLILTQPWQQILFCLPKILTAASKHASKRLYVHLDSMSENRSGVLTLSIKRRLISSIYAVSPSFCPGVDVRILLYGFKYPNQNTPISTHESIDQLLFDTIGSSADRSNLERKYQSFLKMQRALVLFDYPPCVEETGTTTVIDSPLDERTFEHVAVGGTMDRMHPGHKILLSESVLRATKRVVVGVADGQLLKKKVLKELIQPCSFRLKATKDFLTDIDNQLDYEIVSIVEPMGPCRWDPSIQMLVVSEETSKGINMINKHREEKGLSTLESYIIPIYKDCCRESGLEEPKFSSSSQRMRILGTKIRDPVENKKITRVPYVVGLTGGSAAGKTKVAERLGLLGAGIIYCDKLGHQAYQKDTNCYFKLIQHFGKSIVNEKGDIDRKVLSSIVFENKGKLKILNSLVWPEIYEYALKEIQKYHEQGYKIVVLDAAVLLEAKWNEFCHEVWVCILDKEEAIKRIVERDHKTKEEATKRLDAQMTNEERISKANVVLCTKWDYSYTHNQVEKAYNDLLKIIEKL